MKLSEILKQHGYKIEDVEDDEAGVPIPEMRKRLKANQEGFTKESQARAAREKELAEAQGQLAQYGQHVQGLTTELQQLRQEAQTRAEQVAAAGGDWKRDPLFQDIAREFESVAKDRAKSQDTFKALATGLVGIANEFTTFRNTAQQWARKLEIAEMKRAHPDFDEDQVVAVAKQHQLGDWETSYKVWKANDADTLVADAEKRGRDAALKEVEDRGTLPPTEMGGGPAGPSPRGTPKEYNDAWTGSGGLADMLKAAGIPG